MVIEIRKENKEDKRKKIKKTKERRKRKKEKKEKKKCVRACVCAPVFAWFCSGPHNTPHICMRKKQTKINEENKNKHSPYVNIKNETRNPMTIY